MEKKINLNNVQRKMLDEIYMEQFDTLARPILQERQDGLERLKTEVLKSELEKNPMKSVMEKIRVAEMAVKAAGEYMQKNGLKIEDQNYRSKERILELNTYNGIRHPKILRYEEETHKIEAKLAKKKKEIRARVYGLDATYEQVEKEVSRELAEFKI